MGEGEIERKRKKEEVGEQCKKVYPNSTITFSNFNVFMFYFSQEFVEELSRHVCDDVIGTTSRDGKIVL